MATTKTELYNNGTLVATKTSAPFNTFDWTPASGEVGSASLTVKRYEDGVLVATSAAVGGTVDAEAAATYILDDYTGAKLAFSLRQLRAAQVNCLKVRRSSDNALQDIGFVDGVLDTSSLLSFVGGGSGYVHTLYDQTGNNNDWINTSTVAGSQPVIVSTGAVNYRNGKPVMLSTGASMQLNATFSSTAAVSTDFSVLTDTNGFGTIGNSQSDTYNYGIYNTGSSSTSFQSSGVGTPSYYINGSAFSGTTRGDLYTAINPDLRIITTTNVDLRSFTSYKHGYTGVTSVYPPSHFAEKIVYNSDQSANRANIEANMNAYYAAY
jgi:hypothetical protein